MEVFNFKHEHLKLTCNYKLPQRNGGEVDWKIEDTREEASYSTDLSNGNGRPLPHTQEDDRNMRNYVEFASQRNMDDLVKSVTDDRPYWKTLRFWVDIAQLVIAICAVTTLVLALVGVL